MANGERYHGFIPAERTVEVRAVVDHLGFKNKHAFTSECIDQYVEDTKMDMGKAKFNKMVGEYRDSGV